VVRDGNSWGETLTLNRNGIGPDLNVSAPDYRLLHTTAPVNFLTLDERIAITALIKNHLNIKTNARLISHDPQGLHITYITIYWVSMSGRLLAARFAGLARPVPHHALRRFHHRPASAASALLRTESGVRAARRRLWPMGYNYLHNAVAVRNASFVRILPKLVLKFARIPAMFGGAIIAGLAYLQYQATRMV
jgi:hypothetical protein